IRKGSTVTCTIVTITDAGLEVTVSDNIKGYIKKNDLARERADQKTDRYGVGDKVDATVTNIDKKQRRITLSIKAKEIEEEKKAMADYGSSDSGASLGDILGAALAKKDNSSKD
ncbi:MAG: S1 RNA-binding domain-containing protein, partial [Candidatus Puniceispirillales bacterium]